MVNNVEDKAAEDARLHKLRATAFLGLVGGIATIFGFSRTLGRATKSKGKLIEKGGTETLQLLDEGTALALRALGWGTLYAVLGTSSFCYGCWKLSGASNFEEFRQKMGNALPHIPKNEQPSSPTEFDGLTDFMKYLASCAKE